MIPEFEPNGNLPPAIHHTNWETFAQRFSRNAHRQTLLAGLLSALQNLAQAGCRMAYIDGSFVTAKEFPGDFDGCWEAAYVDPDKLDPVLLMFAFGRLAQKARYKGELVPTSMIEPGVGTSYLEFFQTDKRTGQPKGIIALDLTRLP